MTTPAFPSRFTNVESLASSPLERSFRAFDSLTQREVVLKLPALEAWSEWKLDARTRLLREAQALGKVQHEGVLPVWWVDETPDGILIVQPPQTGERLSDFVKQGPMSAAAVVKLGMEVGDALAAVHRQGIVHRGIGLDAVWMQPSGKAMLGAFTFAKAFDGKLGGSSLNHGLRQAADKSADAALLPPYPAPEQLAGRGADPRADVYALGCLMFRCLAGHDPLLSGDGMQMPDVRAVRKDVPKPLGDVIRRCMLVEKTARYPTAQAVVDALRPLAEGEKQGPGPRLPKKWMVAAALLAVGALSYGWMSSAPVGDPGTGTSVASTGDALRGFGAGPRILGKSYQRGHALLIGIGEGYASTEWPTLKTPANEILEVKKALMQSDPALWNETSIQVLLDKDASSDRIGDAVGVIKQNAQTDDCVFIYFAGHGARLAKADDYWLVCNNAVGKAPRAEGRTGYFDCGALADLQRPENCAAKHVLVMLDSCHAGQFLKARNRGSRGIDPEDKPKAPRAERLVEPCLHESMEMIGSSMEDRSALDGVKELSEFCRAFLDKLRQPDAAGYVTATEIVNHIAKRQGSLQPPVYQSLRTDPVGQFVFFQSAH